MYTSWQWIIQPCIDTHICIHNETMNHNLTHTYIHRYSETSRMHTYIDMTKLWITTSRMHTYIDIIKLWITTLHMHTYINIIKLWIISHNEIRKYTNTYTYTWWKSHSGAFYYMINKKRAFWKFKERIWRCWCKSRQKIRKH